MNGRIYDPLLGRFLSADLCVQFPGDLQSYNRYSYVRNNPLTLVDPSGFLDEMAFGQQLFADGSAGSAFLGKMETQSAAGWTYKSFSDYQGTDKPSTGRAGGVTDYINHVMYVQDKRFAQDAVDDAVHETEHSTQKPYTTIAEYRANEDGAFTAETKYQIEAGRPGDLAEEVKDTNGNSIERVDHAAIATKLDIEYGLKNYSPNAHVTPRAQNDKNFTNVQVAAVRLIRLSFDSAAASAASKKANDVAKKAEKAAKKAPPAQKAAAEKNANDARSAADQAAKAAEAAKRAAEEERKRQQK